MNPTRQHVDPAVSERILDRVSADAGMERKDSYGAAELTMMLRQVGYDVVPNTIDEFARKGYCGVPADDQWTAPHIHALLIALHWRRRWLPGEWHWGGKSEARRTLELAEAAGKLEWAGDIEGTTLEDFLLRLVTEDNPGVRECHFECVRAKLAQLGFVEE